MIKTTLEIDGMMCGMCESHINDCLRRNFNVKKVSSSHAKGETVILSETAPDEEMLKKLSIYSAFELYLDFINIFLYILRFVGNRD